MAENKALEALVDDIYLSATDAASRERMPAAFARAVGGATAALWTVDPTTGAPTSPIMTTLPPEGESLYRAHYYQSDPWMTRAHLMGWNRVARGSEIVADTALARSEYYNDFGRHMATFHAIGSRVSLGADPRAPFGALAVFRPHAHEPFTHAEEARLRWLIPHMRRSWQIGHRLGAAGSVAMAAWESGAEAVLQGIQAAAVVTDGHARVRLANAAAERLDLAGGLRLCGAVPGRVLELDEPRNTRWLHDAVADAARRGAGREGLMTIAALGTYHLTVSPLQTRLAVAPGCALVIVTPEVIAPEEATIRRAQHLFGLSRSEAEVALMLVEGRSPAEIAEVRGVRISTVRTQLQRSIEKTDAGDIRGLAVRMTLLRE